jgi:FHA domain
VKRELVIASGPAQGTVVNIDRELVLGREGDVAIDDREVSRRHVAVRPVEQGVQVEDLGSANGTFVDGRRISGAVTVADAGRLQIGVTEVELRVSAQAPAPVEAPAAPTRLAQTPPAPAPPPAAATPPVAAPAAPPAAQARPAADAPPASGRQAPRPGLVLGALAAAAAIALIVALALAASGDSVSTHKVRLKIRTTELYFVGARIGFSGTIAGTPLGSGTITQDQTFGGRPQDILKGPTPVTAKVTCRFEKGTIVGTLRATATPTAAGGTHLDGRLTWSYGTGAYKHIKGSITTTGGRPDIRVPIAAFDTTGEVEY